MQKHKNAPIDYIIGTGFFASLVIGFFAFVYLLLTGSSISSIATPLRVTICLTTTLGGGLFGIILGGIAGFIVGCIGTSGSMSASDRDQTILSFCIIFCTIFGLLGGALGLIFGFIMDSFVFGALSAVFV